MNKALIGRYWPASSFVHSLDAKTKITVAFIMVAVLLFVSSWASMGFCAVCVLAFFVFAKIPISEAFRSIVPLLVIIVLSALFNIFYVHEGGVLLDLGWTQITTGGLDAAAFFSVRLALLMLMGSLLTMTTTTFDITSGIEDMFAPLSRLKVPIHEFAFVISTALGFIPQLADEFESIRMAQQSRGAKLTTTPLKGVHALSSLITPMFASVFRHADTLSLAMDARCYVPGAERGRLNPSHLGRNDFIALASIVVVCTVATLLSIL